MILISVSSMTVVSAAADVVPGSGTTVRKGRSTESGILDQVFFWGCVFFEHSGH
jgi:hypothetical protein